MRLFRSTLAVLAGAACFALAIFVLLCLPGVVSDIDSVVPPMRRQEAPR